MAFVMRLARLRHWRSWQSAPRLLPMERTFARLMGKYWMGDGSFILMGPLGYADGGSTAVAFGQLQKHIIYHEIDIISLHS